MGLLYLLLALGFAIAYLAAMALPVLLLAALGRVGAVAGVVLMGFVARWLAGKYHGVWASEALSLVYLPFLLGAAWALWYASRLAPHGASPEGDVAPLPGPLRHLTRSPRSDERRRDRNLLALTFLVTPAAVLLNYAGECLQRTALGYQTDYLALHTSWDFAKYFASEPLGVGVVLFLGGLLYEGALLRLPPTGPQAADDRRALKLLPLMLAPWIVIGAAQAFTFHGIALVQAIGIYFFLVRRFPEPAPVVGSALTGRRANDPAQPGAQAQGVRGSRTARRRHYAALGGTLGAAVAAFALAGSGLDDSGALAIVGEQLFFITIPASVPLRTLLLVGGDMRYEASARLVAFVLAAPIANGVLLGWGIARGLEALGVHSGTSAEKKTSQSPRVIGS